MKARPAVHHGRGHGLGLLVPAARRAAKMSKKKATEEEKKEREFFLRTDRQANGWTILRILGISGPRHF